MSARRLSLQLFQSAVLLLVVPSASFVLPQLRSAKLGAPGQTARRLPVLSASGPSWAGPNAVPDRAFGCELELLCNDIEDVYWAVDAAGEPAIIPDQLTRDTTKAWKLVRDASLPQGQSVELVSPILRGESGRRRLVTTLNEINARGVAAVDKQCGYHVHIDLSGIDFEGVKRICQNWVKYEDAIDLILPPSRRGDNNRFCQAVRENFNFYDRTNKPVNDRIHKAKNMRSLQDLMNPIDRNEDSDFYNPEGRYFKLNLRTGRNTIEFRAHSATHNPEKAKLWVNFLVAFVEASAKNKAPKSFKDDREPLYKFYCMFEWVVRGKTIENYYEDRRIELE